MPEFELTDLAARILIENIDPQMINKLESIIRSMEQASRDGNLDKMISEDLRFHRTICELSEHRKLLAVWTTLENQLRTFLNIEKDLFETLTQYVATHYPILAAIKSRNTELAGKRIREHLELGCRVIQQGYWEKFSRQEKNGKRALQAGQAPGARPAL